MRLDAEPLVAVVFGPRTVAAADQAAWEGASMLLCF
jgi:hypothetical protein